MKHFAYLCALCLLLSGCGNVRQTSLDTGYVIDTGSIAKNTETIEQILKEKVWNYDNDSFSFNAGGDLSRGDERFAAAVEASKSAGINTMRLENGAEQTMTAAVQLLAPDMTEAGTAYFCFNKKTLLCGYYVYNDVVYSLDNKYPFEYEKPFSAVENKDAVKTYSLTEPEQSFKSVSYIFGGETAVASGSALLLYTKTDTGLKRKETLSYDSDFIPVSAVSDGNTVAALLDTYETVVNENDFEESEEEETEVFNTKSYRAEFLDNKGDAVYPPLELDLSIYTSVALVDENTVALARNKAIDLFEYKDGEWSKIRRLGINCDAEKMLCEDIDGDGIKEYIISDGVNIHVCKQDENRLRLAWSTHFDMNDLTDIFVGDVNGDGVKELYVNNSNGFAVRYVLGQNGFEVYGGGIVTGDNAYYAVGDIDGSGSCDYMKIVSDEDSEDIKIYCSES
ncbi:MAG: VCBS repeat-containing protein [Firmicutes bacterium]|nr:VCBS repeat-containing protein [Bacillota bacterium]